MSRPVTTLARTWHRHRMFAGVMIALALVFACGALVGPCAPEPALAAQPGSTMLTTRAQPTVTDKLGVTRAELVDWLKSHEHDSYYLGTPYYEYGYKAVPNGDCPSWDTPGMNCNGFVHHALCAAHGWRDGIDSKCPDMTGWSDLFASTESYYFSSKEEMLSSGVLEKGALVWMFVQAWSASDYNHIGIYWPEDDASSSEDRWWDSIDSAWDGGNWVMRGTNAITPILPKTASELWIVCKLDSGGNLQLTKSSANPSLTDGNDLYSLADAQYGVYADEACTDLVGTLNCSDDGTSNTLEKLAAGTYYVKETAAPEGYRIDAKVHAVEIRASETTVLELSDEAQVDRAQIKLWKVDRNIGTHSQAQGAATLSGARFTISYYNGIYDEGELPATATRTWVVQANKQGVVDLQDTSCKVSGPDFYTKDDGVCFPLGTVTITETTAPTGYTADSTVHHFKIEASPEANDVEVLHSLDVPDTVMRGNISLTKSDKELARRQAQGKASLAGAVYEVVNANDQVVISPQTGRAVAKGGVVCTMTTDATGAASTDNAQANGWSIPADWDGKALAYGAYLVREKSAGIGYLVNAIWSGTARIESDGAMAHIDTVEQVVRGGLAVGKVDREYREYVPLGGATLEGAAFEIVSDNPGPVIVDGTEYGEGAVVKTIVTSQEADGRFVARTDARSLPYGTYTVREVRSTQGYLLDSASQAWSRTFSITREGGIVDLTGTDDAVSNQVIRGDFSFNKRREADMAALANIPFRITSLTTGEWHIIVTDANGMASTASSWNAHSVATNVNDAVIGADGTIDESKLNASAGIWFSGRTDRQAAVIDGKGALPYDTYRIEELRCSGNEGLNLVRLSLSVSRDGAELDLGTIEDKSGPSIATSLADTQGVKMVPADTIAKLVDTVSYYDLMPGSYVMRGQLHLIGADGSDEGTVAEAERAFTVRGSNGTVKMTFSVDTSDMEGKRLVAFEQVLPEDGDTPVAEHADLADEDQTVTIPEIATTLADNATGGKEAGPAQIVRLTDTVAYSGLDTTKTYTLSAVLHVRDEEGNDVGPALDADGERITARQTFSPDEPDGTAEVTFTFERSAVVGKTLVAFEELLQGEERYAAHARIDDEAQTVTVPANGTTARDAALGGHESCAAEAVEIIDTVEYRGFTPGVEYTVSGTLHLRADDGTDAGVLKSTTGEPITASTSFTPELSDGSVDVVFRFSGSHLGGSTLVVFEQAFRGDELYAEHADISDRGQTISLPALSTSARSEQSGTHAADASVDEAIVDTVAYTNLAPDREYTLQATLHERDAEGGDAGIVTGTDGNPVTASAAFTPESADGSIDVRIPADMEELAGKTVVVFEELYDQNGNTVAHHRDIGSAEQSVTFRNPEAPTEEPSRPEHPETPGKKISAVTGYKTVLPTTGDAVLDTLIPIAIIAGMALVFAATGAAIAQHAERNDG